MKIFLKRDSKKNWLLWWGINPQTIKYPINARKVQASVDPQPGTLEQKLAKYREKLSRIYNGSIESFEGNYSVSEKRLTLKA